MKNLTTIALLFLGISLHAQTVINGRVIDANSGEPLPYVAIRGLNVQLGAVTDFDGYYAISTDKSVDSIVASYMGYTVSKKNVDQNKTQTINFSFRQRN